MQIYILNKQTKSTLKTIAYNDFTLSRYNNKEYNLLYPPYDSSLHTIVIAESLPTHFNIIDGEVVALSNYELYLLGKYELAEGEVIEGESIITLAKPSAYHTFDIETRTYILTDENKAELISALKVELATAKYSKQEGLYISEGSVDNLTASYNYLMLNEAIETYEDDIAVRWKNISIEVDGNCRITITDELLAELKSLKEQTRIHYQKCFNAHEIVELDIDGAEESELISYDVQSKLDEAYNSL